MENACLPKILYDLLLLHERNLQKNQKIRQQTDLFLYLNLLLILKIMHDKLHATRRHDKKYL